MNNQTDNAAVEYPGGGQPPEVQPEKPEVEQKTPAQQQEVPVTISQEQLDEITENLFRRVQGLNTKQADTITRKISEQIKALNTSIGTMKATGIEVTPAQEEAMRQRVITDAYANADEEPVTPGEAPAQRPPTRDQGVDSVTADGWAMMEEAGVYIRQEDPEAELYLAKAQTPRQYFQAIEKAIQAKKARLENTGKDLPETAPPEEPGPGRMPTGSGGPGAPAGDPVHSTMDPDSLWDLAKKRGRV